MGSEELRLRANWQRASGKLSINAESGFYKSMSYLFENTEYNIIEKPTEFKHVYENWPLPQEELEEIYTPTRVYTHGFQPDYSIENTETKKKIYIEVKRQDGWVEGTSRSVGRGNAHERSCKYFTPGLKKILHKESKIENALPFWIVFMGDITRDPCRVREITCWFDEYADHFFFWRDLEPESLHNYFIDKISPLLD